jgi:hypothetical protein
MHHDCVADRRIFRIERLLHPQRAEVAALGHPGGTGSVGETKGQASLPVICG